MWGARWFQFPTFSSTLVRDKISHFMKVIGNEGHHHLTFDIWLAHDLPYIYWMNFKLCVLGVHKLVVMSSMVILYRYLYIWHLVELWLHIVYKWFLIHLSSLWFFWIKPDTYYHIAFFYFLSWRSQLLKTSWDTCCHEFTMKLRRYNIQSFSMSSFLFVSSHN